MVSFWRNSVQNELAERPCTHLSLYLSRSVHAIHSVAARVRYAVSKQELQLYTRRRHNNTFWRLSMIYIIM